MRRYRTDDNFTIVTIRAEARSDDFTTDDFSVKTPQVRLVWKKRRQKCGIFDTGALTGVSIYFSSSMMQRNREVLAVI